MVKETPDRKVNTNEQTGNDDQNRLPHERDESPDGDDGPRGVMKQAASDLEQGLVDTDLRGTPGVEKVVSQDDASGQAKPRSDAADGMRFHDVPAASDGNKQ